jgi:hypothetical protein
MAKTVLSSNKRMVGEYISATRFHYMVKEMMKVSVYNLFRIQYDVYAKIGE